MPASSEAVETLTALPATVRSATPGPAADFVRTGCDSRRRISVASGGREADAKSLLSAVWGWERRRGPPSDSSPAAPDAELALGQSRRPCIGSLE